MTALDRWVVRNVFMVIRQCLEEGREGPLSTCAINLSGSSIGDDKFLEYLQRLFVEYAIPPRMICFEITETSAIANLGSAIRFINELKGWVAVSRWMIFAPACPRSPISSICPWTT